MRLASALLCSAAACTTPATTAPAPIPVQAAPLVAVSPPGVDAGPMPAEEISLALELNCQSCHSLDYVLQQRLTAAQWVATLTKMRSWGAALDEAQVGPLADALAVSHGAASALRDFPVADVPPFRVEPLSGRGDVAHGKALFEGRCLVCHGPDARGGIGVNLADRPLLQHPAAFSSFVKRGRGRMPPHPDLDATQYDDLIAWLRTK